MADYIGIAVFICIGSAALLLLLVPLRKLQRYFTWKQTTATLLNTETSYELVGRFPMSGRTVATFGHVPKIWYQYQVGNNQYESKSIVDPLEDRIWFGNELKAKQFIDSVTSAKSISVSYNPRNPGQSVLFNRLRVADVVAVVAGSTISTMFFYLAVLAWPDAIPKLDFPLYPNAEVHSYPDKDDERKFWTLTSSDDLDDVMTYYDANVDSAWQSDPSWQPGLPGSFFRVWERVSPETGKREEVTVRVQPEKNFVREGLEVSIGYRTEPDDSQTD